METVDLCKKKRVAFFLLNLGAGGVERVVSTLLPEFSRMGVPYIVICLNKSQSFYPIPASSDVFSLRYDFKKIFSYLPNSCFYLIAPFLLGNLLCRERIDCILSFLPLPNLINVICRFLFRKKWNVLLSERSSPEQLIRVSKWYFRIGYKLSVRYAYSFADHIIAISSGIRSDLIELGVDGSKVSVIYNPMSVNTGDEHLSEYELKSIGKKFFLCVGRHEYQKGLDIGIKVLKLLITANIVCSDTKLVIVGTGSWTAKLILLVQQLDLQDRVVFIEKSSSIHSLMARAEMFWFPSRFEGFGNVLVEAISSKILICSTDCPHGPSEILTAYSGLLAKSDSVLDFYDKCCELLRISHIKRVSLIEESYASLFRFDTCMIARNYYKRISLVPD